MHFQYEPAEIAKLVWVSNGAICGVLLDLREGPTYGAVYSFVLDSRNNRTLFVSAGFGTAFKLLKKRRS
jgi:dTDP-4-dehydrorhamnose 3,5-epimerase-like enzyme